MAVTVEEGAEVILAPSGKRPGTRINVLRSQPAGQRIVQPQITQP